MFTVLFERSPDALWLLDPETGRVVDCNPSALELLRAAGKEQLLGRTPSDLSPERQPDGRDSREKAAEVMRRSRQEGGARFHWVMRRFDGTDVHVEVVSTTVPAGARSLHLIISRDITERHRAEQALRESQQILSSIADNLQEAVYRSTPDHRLIFVNDYYLRLFGYQTLEELCSFPRERLYARTEDRARVLSRLARDGHFRGEEVEFVRQDGSHFWGLMSSRAITDPATGEASFLVGSIVDITARKRAEEELRRLNQSLEGMISARTTELQAANERLREEVKERQRREKIEHALFQISEAIHLAEDLNRLYPLIHAAVRELMPARNFYLSLHEPATGLHHFVYHVDEFDPVPPPRKLSTGMTAHVFRTGKALLADRASMLRPPGSREGQGWAVEHGTPSAVWLGVPLVANGQTLGVMAVQDYHDERAYGEPERRLLAFIGEQTALAIARKRADSELRRALEREQELGRLKSNFTSLVSHEFRTPLGVISSSAEILRDYFDRLPPAEREEHLETITKHARRMGGLMDEVLLLSRFEAGKTEFQTQPLQLPDYCGKLAREVGLAMGHACPVRVTGGAGLPPAVGDERLLRHVLTNLLVNAMKYSEPGTPVELRLSRSGSDAVFEVCDRGIGIPEADREWIFEAFHRGGNVGQRPGTGLGLVIVKRCVELHRGSIGIHSEVGQGTTVRVALPMYGNDRGTT